MSYRFVIDAYAWIEYFRGTTAGARARPYIEGGEAATSAITLAELREKYLRERWKFFEDDLNFIATQTVVVPFDRPLAVLAGALNHTHKQQVKGWGMADAIVLATARIGSAKVITWDPHFRRVPDAIPLATRSDA